VDLRVALGCAHVFDVFAAGIAKEAAAPLEHGRKEVTDKIERHARLERLQRPLLHDIEGGAHEVAIAEPFSVGRLVHRRDSAISRRFDQIRIIRMIIGMQEQRHIGS
jgi:hypothetical protein